MFMPFDLMLNVKCKVQNDPSFPSLGSSVTVNPPNRSTALDSALPRGIPVNLVGRKVEFRGGLVAFGLSKTHIISPN